MGAQIRHWTTDSVDEPHRLSYWMDSICESFLEMQARPERNEAFFGSIRQSALGALSVFESRGSAQEVARDQRAIARGQRGNHYYLITQRDTAWSLRHAGRESVVQPGDSVLVDSREPYQFRLPLGLHHLSVQLPIDWVDRWLPDARAALGQPIGGRSGWGDALRAFKLALTPEFAAHPGLPPALIEDQLGALMSLACAAQPLEQRSLRSPYQRCVTMMREHLSDSSLVARTVATHCALSLRSLHRAFASQGRTFAGVLREIRLAEAHRMLADGRFARHGVADIAQRCGYADASHFSSQFRRALGVSPGAFRTNFHANAGV
jgi:AraC family transcriptional regulator, positive regulator of tynA and feaB